jgi:hypothetical protein
LNVRHIALIALASVALGAGAQAQVTAQQTPTPVISVPVSGATTVPSPVATASPAGKRGRKPAPSPEPSASETPTPPQFQTLDGVWEVALQPPSRDGRTIYSHLYVTQKADQITGTWVRKDKNEPKATFSGTFDGRLFSITLNDGAHSYTMAGYEENFADMVGLFKTDKPGDVGVAFTAGHRKKEKL